MCASIIAIAILITSSHEQLNFSQQQISRPTALPTKQLLHHINGYVVYYHLLAGFVHWRPYVVVVMARASTQQLNCCNNTSSNNEHSLLKQKEVDNRPKPLELSSSICIRTSFAVNTLPQQLIHSQSTTTHQIHTSSHEKTHV